jgi:uncharacterized protein YjbJ (UPF0337 family)
MAKFRGPKKMFGKKTRFLVIALVLLFGLWFFFLRGKMEGFTSDEWGKMSKDDCSKNKGSWDDKTSKCSEAVAKAADATSKAQDATSAASDAVSAALAALKK